jgi:putative flippase GtrA
MMFVRYLLIGALAYLIDLGGFLLLLACHVTLFGPVLASILSKLSSSVFSFMAHRYFTFKAQEKNSSFHQAWRYFSIVALNIPLTTGMLLFCLTWLHDPTQAKITADILCVIISYWLSKSFVFTTH